jgi:hypothetical protein
LETLSVPTRNGRFVPLNYCNVENVKSVLQISEDTWDSELLECIQSASALVDGLLCREGLGLPCTSTQILTDSTKFFAAWDFHRRRDPSGAEAFWTEANRILGVYIDCQKELYVGSV